MKWVGGLSWEGGGRGRGGWLPASERSPPIILFLTFPSKALMPTQGLESIMFSRFTF